MDITTADRIAALAAYLKTCADDEPLESITADCAEGYNEGEIEHGRASYLVLTDDEADEAAQDAARHTLWAFNSNFLSAYIPALRDSKAAAAFDKMRESMCEDAGPLVASMLGARLRECVDDAVSADGRGHFLSGYDGDERDILHDGKRWYIYRTN